MPLDLIKTTTYLCIHLIIGFSVALVLTGSVAVASGIALIEPMVNAIAFFFHERVWRRIMVRPPRRAIREWGSREAGLA